MDYIIPAPYAMTPRKGAVVHSEVSGVPTRLANTQRVNFNPRVGFAYELTTKTVLRGGFGMYNAQFHPYGLNQLYDEYNTGFNFAGKPGGDPTYYYITNSRKGLCRSVTPLTRTASRPMPAPSPEGT